MSIFFRSQVYILALYEPIVTISISIKQQPPPPLQSTTNKKQPVFANISLSYSFRACVWCKDSCHWSLYWKFRFVQQSRTETHDFCNLEMLCELPAVYGAETFVVSSRCKCLQWLEGHLFRGGWIMTEEEAPPISFEMHGWFYSQVLFLWNSNEIVFKVLQWFT